ncbi:KUP/HAK/KT family potassium transporter [Bradyrhizobium liaoningense]|uniref:KUP/HAK/KT family potassium transporter n=1 Tax=Bradyrhizobium liaoningense TaxID=43992 RepID=UPI003D676858
MQKQGAGITRVILHYGFTQNPTIYEGLNLVCRQSKLPGVDLSDITSYVGRETIIPSEDIPGPVGLARRPVRLPPAQRRMLGRVLRRADQAGGGVRHRAGNLIDASPSRREIGSTFEGKADFHQPVSTGCCSPTGRAWSTHLARSVRHSSALEFCLAPPHDICSDKFQCCRSVSFAFLEVLRISPIMMFRVIQSLSNSTLATSPPKHARGCEVA